MPAPFDHSKLMVIDESWALIGSANWDTRSFRLNFELNVELHDPDFASTIGAVAPTHAAADAGRTRRRSAADPPAQQRRAAVAALSLGGGPVTLRRFLHHGQRVAVGIGEERHPQIVIVHCAMRCGCAREGEAAPFKLGDGERDVGAAEIDAAPRRDRAGRLFQQQAHAGAIEERQVAEAIELLQADAPARRRPRRGRRRRRAARSARSG